MATIMTKTKAAATIREHLAQSGVDVTKLHTVTNTAQLVILEDDLVVSAALLRPRGVTADQVTPVLERAEMRAVRVYVVSGWNEDATAALDAVGIERFSIGSNGVVTADNVVAEISAASGALLDEARALSVVNDIAAAAHRLQAAAEQLVDLALRVRIAQQRGAVTSTEWLDVVDIRRRVDDARNLLAPALDRAKVAVPFGRVPASRIARWLPVRSANETLAEVMAIGRREIDASQRALGLA
ncbi:MULTISPECIES: hypothetical protein [Curtobacterium]|uniref:Uncharacterized protein n=1 Tax=Curtobacterium subtropicum TaxID=3055138 RepID=A0ABT7TFH3_9MICO|nr:MULTISPECIES: hypothetical protein [Curtobacterium]MDM7888312.1 hypothetical protein [Curtobacterium subtropicum]WJX99629.1 hypothetical protein QPJ90_15155 [Curtobacterium sp. 458]